GVPTRNEEQPESQAPSDVSKEVLRKNHAIAHNRPSGSGIEGRPMWLIFINKNNALRGRTGPWRGAGTKPQRKASQSPASAGLIGLTAAAAAKPNENRVLRLPCSVAAVRPLSLTKAIEIRERGAADAKHKNRCAKIADASKQTGRPAALLRLRHLQSLRL